MIKVTDRLPKRGQVVIAYAEDGTYFFARYDKVLTWSGFQIKFLDLMSRGTFRNDIVGWLPIPNPSSSAVNYKSNLVRKACVKAYNMDFDQLREFYGAPEESYLKEKWHIMQHDFSRWFCDLDSEMAEKFMEGL